MKYKITCDNCDYEFITDGEAQQTVQCQCPHCGGLMKIKLPEAPETPQENKEPRRRTGCGIAVGIFLGLFILILAAMVAYSLTRHESTQPVEDPYARIIVDSTYYGDGFVEEEPQQDTVERRIEQPVEKDTATRKADLDIEEHERIDPSAFLQSVAPSAPAETPEATESTDKQESSTNNN